MIIPKERSNGTVVALKYNDKLRKSGSSEVRSEINSFAPPYKKSCNAKIEVRNNIELPLFKFGFPILRICPNHVVGARIRAEPAGGLDSSFICQFGNSMISLRIHLIANQGKQGELRQTIENLSQRIAGELGCQRCWVFQSTSDQCEMVLIEEWENLESALAHVSSGNMAILAGAGTILTKDIRVYPERDPDMQMLENVFKAHFSQKFKPE